MAGYEVVKAWRAKKAAEGTLRSIRAAEARAWRKRNPETAAAVKARYRASNIDAIRTKEAYAARERRRNNPEAQRARNVSFSARREFVLGIRAGSYRSMCCELCGAVGKTVFDHDHQSGGFRGWICDRCNKTLGLVLDDPSLLRAMADYLETKSGEIDLLAEKQAA